MNCCTVKRWSKSVFLSPKKKSRAFHREMTSFKLLSVLIRAINGSWLVFSRKIKGEDDASWNESAERFQKAGCSNLKLFIEEEKMLVCVWSKWDFSRNSHVSGFPTFAGMARIFGTRKLPGKAMNSSGIPRLKTFNIQIGLISEFPWRKSKVFISFDSSFYQLSNEHKKMEIHRLP